MLIKCSECGERISDKSEVCLKCGCPMSISIKKEEKEKQSMTNEIEQEDSKYNIISYLCSKKI